MAAKDHGGEGEFARDAAPGADLTVDQSFALETVSRLKDRILEMLGRQAPLADTAEAICLAFQSLVPWSVCSVLMARDDRLSLVAAPGLPQTLCALIDDLPIAPDGPACARAAHFKSEVIDDDPWSGDPGGGDPGDGPEAPFGSVAGFKPRRAWSTPVLGAGGALLGTLAVYFRDRRDPSAAERDLVRQFAWLTAIAVEHFMVDRKLIDALTAANEAHAVRATFLSVVSHELRTPLNAIIGFSEAMAAEMFGPLGNPRYRDYATHIRDSGHMLIGIINDLLDLGRAEARRLSVHPETVGLGALLGECRAVLSGMAEKAGVDLDMRLADADLTLLVDPLRIKQILINLGANAIKFTQRGGAVAIRGAPAADGGVDLIVTDNGIGMTAEEQAIALEPFRQVRNRFTGRFDGSGLGLPIAKALVESHGGSLSLTSARRQGTTAKVHLPAACVAGKGSAPQGPGDP